MKVTWLKGLVIASTYDDVILRESWGRNFGTPCSSMTLSYKFNISLTSVSARLRDARTIHAPHVLESGPERELRVRAGESRETNNK